MVLLMVLGTGSGHGNMAGPKGVNVKRKKKVWLTVAALLAGLAPVLVEAISQDVPPVDLLLGALDAVAQAVAPVE